MESPIVTFKRIEFEVANRCLLDWQHKMGVFHRSNQVPTCHALFHGPDIVGVTLVSTLIRPNVGGGLKHLTRQNCCELARLCAVRPGLCRVVLRLWREFVFPTLGYEYAISYQDRDVHTGNTYRFDGWFRAAFSHSGNDRRSGKKGRNKYVWLWPPSLPTP